MNYNKSNVRLSVLFWLLYFLYEWIGQASIANEYHRYLVNALVIVPITGLATLFTTEGLIKKYFLKRKITAFWVGFGVSAVAFTLIRRAFNYYYTYPKYYPGGNYMPYLFPPKIII